MEAVVRTTAPAGLLSQPGQGQAVGAVGSQLDADWEQGFWAEGFGVPVVSGAEPAGLGAEASGRAGPVAWHRARANAEETVV